MAEMKGTAPNQPVTASEVAAWFPHIRFGAPDIAKCAVLALAVERTRAIFRILEADDHLNAGKAFLPAVTKAARLLKQELQTLAKEAGPYGKSWEIANLYGAIMDFLDVAPGQSMGRQESAWMASALKWAPLAAACLKKEGKDPSSQLTLSGPVAHVLCKAVARVYGKTLTTPDLYRRLQEYRDRQKKRSYGN